MKVCLVSGSPATGKTTIAKTISEALGFTFLTKDYFKEKLFESDGRSNIMHNTWYEHKSKEYFVAAIIKEIDKGNSIVIESNFEPRKDRETYKNLLEGIHTVEIYCEAGSWTTLKRFIKRNESGNSNKHPMHHDRVWYGQMFFIAIIKSLFNKTPYSIMGVGGSLLIVDTSDFENVNPAHVIEFIKNN